MKICVLSGATRKAGGLFYAVSSLCKALFKCSLKISVFGRTDESSKSDLDVWKPVDVYGYKACGPLNSSFELRKLLKSCDASILHLHGIWLYDQWASLQWQKLTGRPVVISPHGMLDSWAVQNSAWKKKLVGKLFANESLKNATCIHALCEAEAKAIRTYGLKNPIAIIPNGVELPEKNAQNLSQKKSERKRLLFLGRIHPKKGLKELIEAWRLVVDKHKQNRSEFLWELVIAGWDDGGHEAGLKQLAEELGFSDEDENAIRFVGPKFGIEKDQLLREVDAFILPSFSEGLPMSVLEAWSYCLPVVMTEFCNIPDGFKEHAAVCIDPNPDSIASGLNTIFGLPQNELSNIGNNGRKLVEERFEWGHIAQQMMQVYEWCVKGGEPPACVSFYED